MGLRRFDWDRLSLAGQFALAGGVVMLLATIVVGYWVSARIEEIVVRNTANATALYMESSVAPLTQDLSTQERLRPESREEIARLLSETALGKRVVSFKIWRPGGLLVDASNQEIVGRVFPVTENLRLAWQGAVRADFEDTVDEEDRAEAALGVPLLEIYSPIHETGTGKVIAVAEFYEIATQLEQDLRRARAMSWLAVAAVMAAIFASLFAIVLKGSRTIDRQILALQDLSARNVSLRLRVQSAAGRATQLGDLTLRRIGADLHDGPAQLMGFAALRLDALRKRLTSDAARAELDAVEKAVKDAILEIRTIARGLSLPEIGRRPVEEIVRDLAEAHGGRIGQPVSVAVDWDGSAEVPEPVKICLYRAVQEGLTNGWRHGGGKGQEVRLSLKDWVLRVEVLDRGPGFAELPPARGEDDDDMGLAGLADRVESLGGRLDLSNRSDGPGAALVVTIDLGGL